MADENLISQELALLAHREAMLRRAAKRMLDEATRLRERHNRIMAQIRRARANGDPPPDLPVD